MGEAKRRRDAVERGGGKFSLEDELNITSKIRRDAVIKSEARRYLKAAMESSQRLLVEAAVEKGDMREQEALLMNERAMNVMAKFIEAQEAMDEWHATMLVLIERRMKG